MCCVSLLCQVPRLLMDLEKFVGYRVFADDAKARCRELDHCGTYYERASKNPDRIVLIMIPRCIIV